MNLISGITPTYRSPKIWWALDECMYSAFTRPFPFRVGSGYTRLLATHFCRWQTEFTAVHETQSSIYCLVLLSFHTCSMWIPSSNHISYQLLFFFSSLSICFCTSPSFMLCLKYVSALLTKGSWSSSVAFSYNVWAKQGKCLQLQLTYWLHYQSQCNLSYLLNIRKSS